MTAVGRMRTLCCTTLLLLLGSAAPAATAATDLEVEQLRRDVRELERTVRTQSRRIDDLERALRGGGTPSSIRSAPNGSVREEPDARWLVADRWRALKVGTSAAEVLSTLGLPTAVRPGESANERLLIYTLKLDVGAFLSGSVRIADDRVVAIEMPTLK